MPKAEIVAIGSELLLGQTVDTNSAWLAQRLNDLGVDVFHISAVGDNPERMGEVIARALDRSDVVIAGGGLGPTQDDLTREVIAEVTGRPLVLDPALLEQIETRFRRRGLVMTPNNGRQAQIPSGAIPIENPNGTAPAFAVEDARGVIIALPGVPFELKWLFDERVAPYLREWFRLSETLVYRVLKVADLGESSVDDRIGRLIAGSRNPTVGVLAHPGQVDVRIAAKAAGRDRALEMIAPIEAELRSLLAGHVFASDGTTMEDVVGRLLAERDATVASFEDLSSGAVSERLRQAAPERFVEGIVGNGAGSLRRLLESSDPAARAAVPPADAGSLAEALARAVRARTGATWGLALHGVAEPGEAAVNLGRGRTFLAVTDGSAVRTRSYNIAGTGVPDRARMSFNAMNLLRLALLDNA